MSQPEVPSTENVQPSPQPPRLVRPFLALAYREFRLLWLGQVCQASAGWAERVTRSWLALELTGSAFQLGALELTRGLASLLVGSWGGVLADRMDKRVLLMIVQTWTFSFYALMAWLAFSGHLELWHLYASALGLSLSSAVNQPVRASLVPSLVPEALVINALSLNSIATNATRMGTPILAAGLIQVTGHGGWGYVVCAGLYLLVLRFTGMLRVIEERTSAPRSILGSLVEGWRFVVGHRPVLTQAIIGVGPLTIGFTYQTLLVVYATETLGQGAAAYGALFSCAGFGALVGGLMVAARGADLRRGRLLMLAGLLNGAAMLGLGALGVFPAGGLLFLAAVPLLMLAGGSQTSFRAANNGLMLASTPRELRGRVMSLDEGFRSIGTVLAPVIGALADATTPAVAMASIGIGCLLVVCTVLAWQPHVRDL
jgi:MFS family permease